MNNEDLESATSQFIELSNELRINMLLDLQNEGRGRISEIAKKYSIPAQEVARNFKRMNEAELIGKNSDGEYHLTRIGQLACYNIPSFVFMGNHKKYFKSHTFGTVPTKYIQRLGAFIETELISGVPKILDRWKSIYNNASKKIRVISSELFDAEFVDLIIKKIKDDHVSVSYVISSDTIMPTERKEDLDKEGLRHLINEKKIQRRMLKKIRVILVTNDNEAMVMFPSIDEKADMREAFYGNDPNFIEWCNDYFTDCWEMGDSFTGKKIKYFDKEYPE